MPAARYRIFDFGTIYLTAAQRQAPALIVGVEVQNARLDYFESGKRLPPQGIWAYITQRWQDWVDGPEIEVRFRKQRHVLWNDTTPIIQTGACTSTNALATVILTELAKKPNIPPLPPSLPPTGPIIQNSARSVLLRPGSLSIKSACRSDMDVYLWWTDAPDDGSDSCKTPPLPDPPIPPVSPVLPQPSGAWNGPQYPVPPALPPSAPPIGGGSLVQGTPFPGDQSLPPSAATQTTFRFRIYQSATGAPCNNPPPQIVSVGPFAGIRPQGDATFGPPEGQDGETGFPCGATRYQKGVFVDGLRFESVLYNGYAPPEFIEPIYS